MTEDQEKNLCELFKGGKCPFCDDEWENFGSYKEAQKINKLCCKNSYHPNDKDLLEMGMISKDEYEQSLQVKIIDEIRSDNLSRIDEGYI